MRAVLLTLLLGVGAAAVAEPSQVVLVRHAEKAVEPGNDPSLSDAGRQRAEQLAEVLRHAGVTHIVTTRWQRTQQTAAPLARQLGLTPRVLDGKPEEVATQLRQLDGVVLVVGHSNTVPALLAALGGPRLPNLCEDRFGALFVWQPGPPARTVQARYGAPDPGPKAECS